MFFGKICNFMQGRSIPALPAHKLLNGKQLLGIVAALMLALAPMGSAYAIGDPATGSSDYNVTYGCSGCHVAPQPGATASVGAFSGMGSTVYALSFYANIGGDVAGAANPGYGPVPAGNTWGCLPGDTTATCYMSALAATLGSSGAPTAVANDIAAYFASLFTPGVTNPGTITYGSGAAVSNQITGTYFVSSLTAGWSTAFSATGLPAGVSINAATGLISGTTPTVSAPTNYTVTVYAKNQGNVTSGSATFTFTVNPPIPVITSAATVNVLVGTAFNYQITATNTPTNYYITGTWPAGLTPASPSFTASGLITGTPTQIGTFATPIVEAYNVSGWGTKGVTINVWGITSAATASGTEGTAFTYNVTTNGTLSGANPYGATGLPSGLSINTATGAITGVPMVAGTFPITVSAATTLGVTSTTVSITIAQVAPVITSATTASGSGGTAFSYQITANYQPASFNATGLPAGLGINTATGLISGTPTVNGSFPVTISATNAAGTGSTTLTITLTATAPAITSATTASGSGGAAFSYQITASNVPTSFNATGLPAGLGINTATGLISGTPTVNGSFPVTISATNAAGTGSATLTITLTATAPVITSATTASGSGGAAFSYQITASNVPTSFNATGLPAGLSVNTATGLISGTPTVNGSFPVTISATNAGGTGSATLTITLTATAPAITSATTANGSGGVAFSYQITASNVPTSFNATGLPAGLSVNTATGLISGTPTVNGTFPVTISATNAGGTGSATLTITLSASIPVITSATTASGSGGFAFSYQITASNIPTSFNAAGLPAGLSVNTATGLISGTPTVNGSFPVTISASNASGTGSATLTITLTATAPVITSATTASGSGGSAFSYQITASNVPTSFNATGLPAGLSVNTATGLISGTPTVNGAFAVTISATNAAGTGSATLTITLTATAPVITSATTASGSGGAAFSYQITASNVPTSFNATGLPAGLSVNTATGLISGTPSVNGTFAVTISATNAAGTGSATLTITLTVTTPVVTSAATASGSGGAAFSYQITAGNLPTSFNATGLPAGLSVNTATGLISGTPTVNGSFTVTISATNAAGTGSTTLTITLSATAPVITSATTSGGSGGSAFSYQITASNVPTSFNATGLPAGLSVNTATGLISGTPTVNGAFAVTISATNAGGTGSATLTITLTATAPVITSSTTASGSGGSAFSYQITASNVPTSFNATGLPAGLSVNTSTGLISGTPSVNGFFAVTISATNAGGTGSATLTITLSATAPVITSAASASGSGGTAFSYQITASNIPTSFNATGLPAGLSVNTSTGLISGTPSVNGAFAVTISATNAAGTGSATLNITLTATAPVISSATTASGNGGAPFSYQITASNVPTSFNATGLPAGVTVNTVTGLISGTPATAGTFAVTISATNAAGTGSATLTITLGSLPTTASAATMTVQLNTAATLDLLPFITGTAPSGISIAAAPAHGVATVSGTKVTYTPATDYFGTDTFTYVAYGSGGASQPATVTVTIIGRPDPTKDADVTGLINLQTETAKRFRQAQMLNFQQRLESRHHAIQTGSATDFASRTKTMALMGNVESFGGESSMPGDSRPGNAAQFNGSMPAPGQRNAVGQNNDGAGSFSSVLLANTVVTALSSSSVNLASLLNGGKSNDTGDLSIWGAGNLRFGTKNQPGGSNTSFATDGVSIGMDRRFSEQLTLGMGIGYARDKSTVGLDGTGSSSSGNSVTVYASYQPSSTMFVDGLLGYGALNMDTNRYVAAINDFARVSRTGSQGYGSVATGYEYRDEGFLISPYARYDLAVDQLDAATETGAGLYALNYGSQSTRSQQVSLGLRAESQHQIDSGMAQPRVRIEYQHHLEGANQTSIAYADLLSSRYNLTIPTTNSNSLLFGMGSAFALDNGLNIDFEYQRLHSVGQENNQSFNLRLSKQLDGRNSPSPMFGFASSLGLMVDAGYSYDSNVTHAATDSADIRSDKSVNLNLSKSGHISVSEFMQLALNGFAELDQFRTYSGLGHASVGAQAELKYRSSGEFDTAIYGIFGRASTEQYQSMLRDGYRFSGGFTVRKPITDRINLFAALAANERRGKSAVFDTRDNSARMNLDYALDNNAALYFSGEYRKGDLVFSGQPSLAIIDISTVLVQDDVFMNPQLFDYRVKGQTILTTLGYNLPLGSKDSLDFSWRRAKSTPTVTPGYAAPGIQYIDNQIMIDYLVAL